MTSKNHQSIRVSQNGRVLVITIDNPPVNFLTTGIMVELSALLTSISKRTDVGAVIVTGATKGIFLTHFDVNEIEAAVASIPFVVPLKVSFLLTKFEKLLSHIPFARRLIKMTPMGGAADMNLYHEVTSKMRSMNKVFIAAINGRAMGGGCELALACDLRVMAQGDMKNDMVIGQPEALIGLLPGGGGTQMLTRSLGVFKALEHCLDATPVDPATALELGIVNKVVPADELLPVANQWAEKMARRSPFAIACIKKAIYQGAALDFDSGMNLEKNLFLSAASQKNTRSAMNYYIPKVRQLIKSEQPWLEALQPLVDGHAVDMTET